MRFIVDFLRNWKYYFGGGFIGLYMSDGSTRLLVLGILLVISGFFEEILDILEEILDILKERKNGND